MQHGHRVAIRSYSQANDAQFIDLPTEAVDTRSLSDFIRFLDNGDAGVNLETAIISYRKPFPYSILQPNLRVDLVSAVHIADKDYFAALQEKLGSYDRVLYEMVADKDPRQTNRNPKTRWRPPRRLSGSRRRNFSFFALVQRSLALILTLDFQLECMDYRKENWYHADLDYETFCTLQLARGESLFTFARELAVISLKTIARSSTIPEDLAPWRAKLLWAAKALPMPLVGLFVIEGVCAPPDAPLKRLPEMKALLDLDLPAAIKVLLAKQIATDFAENATLVVENSVIIGERNRVAMEELREALREGCKKVAIFYGGGHMPDMDRRLRQDFGLVSSNVQWWTAWSIKGRRRINKGRLSTFLRSLAKISGWPLNRYQTSALILLSWVLAIDLWFWELLLDALNKYVNELIVAVAQLLDKAWEL